MVIGPWERSQYAASDEFWSEHGELVIRSGDYSLAQATRKGPDRRRPEASPLRPVHMGRKALTWTGSRAYRFANGIPGRLLPVPVDDRVPRG